ncbi:ABC transporter permease [Actinoplanes xinjiangensis]|jgi:ABC-2 type transport system permease protein|uniref:Transport permease protein n=1 Tax=Actinoplanes xinjiangensis TaxID=512350 RepID=A0A316FTZ8_9ACTN|nr:ABC transporter permease [Actinoplanes xinjiangensis]PWK51196.1 ABC-2 type transport system permease protein [Actinoplanes xinjiangensis]GIF39821.1 transport permease protein [Actinoplanes xinjiangensis]
MSVFTKLTLTEFRLTLRDPLYAFFTLLFPVLLVLILGNVPTMKEAPPELGGLRVIDLYAGLALGLAIGIIGLQGLPSVLATYRERGILRRLATTPAPPVTLLAAQLVMNLVTVLVSMVLVYTVAILAFDVPFPENPALFLLAVLLNCAGAFSLGLLLAAVAPTGKTANAIGTFLFFPLMFFAGLWVPRELMPEILRRIGDFTPLAAGQDLMTDALMGQSPALLSITVLVGYLVICGAAAIKLFRWE